MWLWFLLENLNNQCPLCQLRTFISGLHDFPRSTSSSRFPHAEAVLGRWCPISCSERDIWASQSWEETWTLCFLSQKKLRLLGELKHGKPPLQIPMGTYMTSMRTQAVLLRWQHFWAQLQNSRQLGNYSSKNYVLLSLQEPQVINVLWIAVLYLNGQSLPRSPVVPHAFSGPRHGTPYGQAALVLR